MNAKSEQHLQLRLVHAHTLRTKSRIPNPISSLSNQLSTVIPYNTKDQKDFARVVMRLRVVVEWKRGYGYITTS